MIGDIVLQKLRSAGNQRDLPSRWIAAEISSTPSGHRRHRACGKKYPGELLLAPKTASPGSAVHNSHPPSSTPFSGRTLPLHHICHLPLLWEHTSVSTVTLCSVLTVPSHPNESMLPVLHRAFSVCFLTQLLPCFLALCSTVHLSVARLSPDLFFSFWNQLWWVFNLHLVRCRAAAQGFLSVQCLLLLFRTPGALGFPGITWAAPALSCFRVLCADYFSFLWLFRVGVLKGSPFKFSDATLVAL